MSLRQLLAAGVATLLAAPAAAQTPFPFVGKATNPNAPAFAADTLNTAGSTKLDYSGALGLVPDAYKLPADGLDDAPSFQRAINLACTGVSRHLRLQGRHYSMRSPIVQPCLLNWQGQGWQEQPVGTDLTGATLAGSWLDFTAGAFGTGGTSVPVTFSGAYAAGSIIAGFGVSQPVAMPAAGDTTWTPADTPFLLAAENVNGGVDFRDIMCRGVNRCLSAHISGRTSFRNIRGQAWRMLILIDKSYDASRVDEIHVWPYYSTDSRIMAWQQAGAAGIYSYRNDTPLFGRLFFFGLNIGLLFDNSGAEGTLGGGTTTGASVDSLSCDFVRHCLYGTAAAVGAQAQIGQIRSYGQAWGATDAQVAGRTGMLPGSDVIALVGSGAVVQVGNLENYGTDDTTIRLNGAATSIVQVGSAYVIGTRLSANATLATTTGGAHAVTFAMPPVITADTPTGWAFGNGSGTGSVYWPTAVKRN